MAHGQKPLVQHVFFSREYLKVAPAFRNLSMYYFGFAKSPVPYIFLGFLSKSMLEAIALEPWGNHPDHNTLSSEGKSLFEP